MKRKVSIKIDTIELLKVKRMRKYICLQCCKAIDTALEYRDAHRSFSLRNRSCVIRGTFLDILDLNDLMEFIVNDDAADYIRLCPVGLEAVLHGY